MSCKYDETLMNLAKDVGVKVYRYGEKEIVDIADWIVTSGVNTGLPTAWIAAQYKSGHFALSR